jgi:hypothetical protein
MFQALTFQITLSVTFCIGTLVQVAAVVRCRPRDKHEGHVRYSIVYSTCHWWSRYANRYESRAVFHASMHLWANLTIAQA